MCIRDRFLSVFSFDTEQFQPFESFTIKVLRYTPDQYEISNKLYYNTTKLSFAEAIIEDKLNYPYSAYAAVMLDSKDYTTVPTRSYEIRGIKCKVPTNYVPRDTLDNDGNRTTAASYKRNISSGVIESSYQDWDGKFRGDKKEFPDADSVNHLPVYTNNPAWVFYDLLTNPRYGVGTYLYPDGVADLIDVYSLYEVAQYCDELVPNGKGGMEPRFECNVYISKSSEAIKVFKDLLTTFRGIMLWHDGEVTMSLQREKAPIFTFGQSNVIGGQFNYTYPSKRVRANQIRVTWNDPENNYKQTVEVVEDTDSIAKEGRITSKATVAFGCTSQSQAHRVGKFHLLTELMDDEAITFASGIGGQILRPGDLIEVQDSTRDNVQLSGRVSSGASTTVIPVDRSVALSNTANADLTLIFPKSGAYLAQPEATIDSTVFKSGDLILQAKNSSNALYNLDDQADISNARDDSANKIQIAWSEDARIETKAISSYNATHVVVSSAFSSAPDQETIFAISQTTAEGDRLAGSPITYMISEVKENDDKTFAIAGVKHNPGKYDMIDRGWSVPTVPDVMRPPKATDGVPSPRNLALRLQKGIADNSADERTTNAYEERFAPPRLDVYWSAPFSLRKDNNNTSIQSPYEHIKHYEISHNLYNQTAEQGQIAFDTIVIDSSKTTYTFENVPKGGTYIFRIKTVANNGAKSPVVQRVVTINPEKPGKQLEPKIRFGGALTSPMSINSSTALVSLSDSTYNMTPAEAEIQTYIVTNGTTAQTSQSFSSLANGNTAYMLHDFSDTTDPWKAIEYVIDTTGSSTFRYAKQVGVAAFAQKTGTANTVTGNTIIVGTNTTFTTEYEAGDLFVFDAAGSTRHISTINHIHSNTELEISHPPTANLTNKNIFAQTLQPNFIKDTIIGEVANTSGTFSLINYASGNRGEDAYRISGTNENHTFPANSSGAISDFSGYTNAYTVKKGTISYSFAASGTVLNTFGLSLATSNCTAALDGSGNITVSALTADTGTITVTVTDRGDSNATIDTRIITLTKAKAGSDGTSGSIGSDAKVVSLTASDSSIIYNAAGASPTPSTSTDITLTATAKNFTDPRMKFTGDGISDETSFTATGVSGGVKTFTFPVPASINTSPQTVQVEVQEGASGGTVALDTLTIVSVKPGSDGSDGADAITVNLTNESHTFPASAAGVVSSFSGSGTKIEVFKGATLLTPVANTATPSTNEYKVTTNLDTNISVGSYTLDTTGTDKGVTIGDHSGVANGTDLSEIEYSINVENSITLTKAQNFNKSKDGSDGSTGGTGPRSASGYIYYQSSSASSPTSGQAVVNSGVSFNFGTQILSGGVIGTSSTNWNQIQPTFTGSNSNKYWYAYYAVTEATFGGTQTITFSIPYLGQNFTGLVTFTGTNAVGDGTNGLSFGSSGTTQIDGGKITTGTILAARISTDLLRVTGDAMTGGTVGGWTITPSAITGGTATGAANAAFASSGGIQLGDTGYISSKNFYVDTDGNAKFKGVLEGATGSFSGSISVGAFNTAYSGSTAETEADAAAAAASAAHGQANTATSNAATAASAASSAHGQANTATSNAATAASAASAAHGQANTATTNAANADTKAGNAYGQANTATTNAATAQSTADSKVTHAAVNTSSTIVGGGIGGWGITQFHLAGGAQASSTTRDFTIGTSSSGNATFLANGGIVMGSDGFISSNTFYIDASGNAKFKGTLEGDDITVNGNLVLPSAGANVSGSTVGTFATNVMDNKFVTTIGTGAGFYQGYVRLTGGTDHVKTISIQIRDGSSTASEGNLIYETPRIDLYTAGNLSQARLFSSAQTANMPIAFSYTGSATLAAFVRAQGDSTDVLGSAEARFIKFGTTDPIYTFANQTGVAQSTAFYSNTQVVGGFAGTKTLSISNTSFTKFKIDNGSFGTSNQNIANGSYVNVEITSASSGGTTRSTTVTIGESSQSFSVTTSSTGGGNGGGGGGGGCFVEGTPVVMSDGSLKAIEAVAVNDTVKSFKHSSLDASSEDAWETWTATEIASGSFGTSTVKVRTNAHEYNNYYWINYNLRVTNEHPMLAFKDGVFKFVEVSNLAVGDYLVLEDGSREEIFAIPQKTINCLTYNMDVEEDDTYVVKGGNGNGYIAHNVGGNQKQ